MALCDSTPTEDEIKSLANLYTCTRNCFGQKGNAAGCCSIGSRDFIIGPITDPKQFLKRLEAEGHKYSFDQVFINFNEGKKLFPHLANWQNPSHYPALRVTADSPHSCRFLSENKQCTVYAVRPEICRSYQCEHLQKTLANL